MPIPACAPTATRPGGHALLGADSAATYAEWFATLSDATRVRLLHAVATAPRGSIKVGDLATVLGISQSTCSHHVRKLAEVGFVAVDKVGTSSIVSVNPACCTGLPHAADVVMGSLGAVPCCPEDLPADVTTRAMADDDLPIVRDIYAEGIATRMATFETEVPALSDLADKWLPGHRWVAEQDGRVVGWTAINPVSERECYAGRRRDQRLRHRVRARARRRQGAAATARSTRPTPTACGPSRPRSSPRTAPPSRCTTPPATAPSPCARGSPSSTGSGATPCCSSGAARPTDA